MIIFFGVFTGFGEFSLPELSWVIIVILMDLFSDLSVILNYVTPK